ncbi:uncharacterized protein LOC134527985 [Bacillus rossius redtenbacheri]|uniref:uncharacterized protein LOC134527985 n=1 Tax=Bacillus rossius redtenbacheri TaxID=93214 RepID=UPI002FDD6D24
MIDEEGCRVACRVAVMLVWRTVRCLCVSLASRFYRFLARFSGRRRGTGSAAVGGGAASRPARPLGAAPCAMPPPLATALLVVSTVLSIAEACSSRSTPKPRPPPPTARPNVTFHTYACPPKYAEWYCLNGATCFTVKIGESLLYNCECVDGYMGQRCEFKDLEGSYVPSRQRVMLETASIAGGATIAVVLVVIVFIAIYIHFQRKQKEARTSAVDGNIHDLEEIRPFSRSLAISMTHQRTQPLTEPTLSSDSGRTDIPGPSTKL